jgi:hypothetical protein
MQSTANRKMDFKTRVSQYSGSIQEDESHQRPRRAHARRDTPIKLEQMVNFREDWKQRMGNQGGEYLAEGDEAEEEEEEEEVYISSSGRSYTRQALASLAEQHADAQDVQEQEEMVPPPLRPTLSVDVPVEEFDEDDVVIESQALRGARQPFRKPDTPIVSAKTFFPEKPRNAWMVASTLGSVGEHKAELTSGSRNFHGSSPVTRQAPRTRTRADTPISLKKPSYATSSDQSISQNLYSVHEAVRPRRDTPTGYTPGSFQRPPRRMPGAGFASIPDGDEDDQ